MAWSNITSGKGGVYDQREPRRIRVGPVIVVEVCVPDRCNGPPAIVDVLASNTVITPANGCNTASRAKIRVLRERLRQQGRWTPRGRVKHLTGWRRRQPRDIGGDLGGGKDRRSCRLASTSSPHICRCSSAGGGGARTGSLPRRSRTASPGPRRAWACQGATVMGVGRQVAGDRSRRSGDDHTCSSLFGAGALRAAVPTDGGCWWHPSPGFVRPPSDWPRAASRAGALPGAWRVTGIHRRWRRALVSGEVTRGVVMVLRYAS